MEKSDKIDSWNIVNNFLSVVLQLLSLLKASKSCRSCWPLNGMQGFGTSARVSLFLVRSSAHFYMQSLEKKWHLCQGHNQTHRVFCPLCPHSLTLLFQICGTCGVCHCFSAVWHSRYSFKGSHKISLLSHNFPPQTMWNASRPPRCFFL